MRRQPPHAVRMLEGAEFATSKEKANDRAATAELKTGLTAQAMKELLHYKLRVVTRPTL